MASIQEEKQKTACAMTNEVAWPDMRGLNRFQVDKEERSCEYRIRMHKRLPGKMYPNNISQMKCRYFEKG